MNDLKPKTMLRDSLIVLAVMAAVVAVVADLSWVVGVLAGGALGVLNLFLLHRLVLRLAAGTQHGATLLALLVKSLIGVGLLFVLLSWLEGLAVMLGVSAVVVALTLRGTLSLFALPQES